MLKHDRGESMRFYKDCIYYVGRKHKNGMYCRKHHNDVLQHTMSEYGYHGSLFHYIYGVSNDLSNDQDVRTRAMLVLITSHEDPNSALQYYLDRVREDTELEVFENICREKGGEPEPLPCGWFNAYCEEGEECVYAEEPLFIDEELGMYCCKPMR